MLDGLDEEIGDKHGQKRASLYIACLLVRGSSIATAIAAMI